MKEFELVSKDFKKAITAFIKSEHRFPNKNEFATIRKETTPVKSCPSPLFWQTNGLTEACLKHITAPMRVSIRSPISKASWIKENDPLYSDWHTSVINQPQSSALESSKGITKYNLNHRLI